MRVAGVLLIVALLAGCGYRGSLYLPGRTPPPADTGR
ncbi:MAG: hypothetical protein FGM40_09115 [Rhodocyclaceae bacterium]|nr:hypothetical protein [Rhodocyclaceae bacterium]